MSLLNPDEISDNNYRFDSFENGNVLLNKKKNRLPAMGWNSWNAFGSGNTENLTKATADKIIELELNKFGYEFIVLDDGCYKSERENGKLTNEPVKFPNGFKTLSDYIHSKGLKFGMYNDIGTNLCAGAAVGTCGYEKIDAESYVDWGVDFLKIDNCYYLWDNATFSNPENLRFVFCPRIKSIQITQVQEIPSDDFKIWGNGIKKEKDFFYNIGTFDGTNTGTTPVGKQSGELYFEITSQNESFQNLTIEYATDCKNGTGEWLQLAVNNQIVYDNLLPPTPNAEHFEKTLPIRIYLKKGKNKIRIMNHRRQENTLCSYAAFLNGLNLANPNHNILLSICEWGKTQPQNWAYKIGDSWRILNDITFRVGSDGDAGFGEWNNEGTQSVTSQYNKAVIMDEFAGLEKGWNDPDMLMIGMKGLSLTMNKTHFTMWCMMNSPLFLGMDLRRLTKNDDFYNIITNKDLIDLNQDKLGIQAKRIWTSVDSQNPDKDYITDNNRADILAKPLADKSIAISVINLSDLCNTKDFTIEISFIKDKLKNKISQEFEAATKFVAKNLWTKQIFEITKAIKIEPISACDNVTLKIMPVL